MIRRRYMFVCVERMPAIVLPIIDEAVPAIAVVPAGPVAAAAAAVPPRVADRRKRRLRDREEEEVRV